MVGNDQDISLHLLPPVLNELSLSVGINIPCQQQPELSIPPLAQELLLSSPGPLSTVNVT